MARLESMYSTQVSAMASDVLVPAQVQNLQYTLAQGQVLLTWDAVTTNSDGSTLTDLGGYRIYRKKNAGDTFVQIGEVNANTTSFTDNTMKDGASYIYAVSAFDDEETANEGVKSNELAVKTIPSIPQGLVAAAFDRKIVLSWSSVQNELDPELNENLAGYNIYRSEVDGGPYTLIGAAAATETSFEDTTVANGVTYYYVITAYDNSL